MTVDLAHSGRYVFYLNFRTIGDGEGFAVSEQNFNFSELIDDASKYLCSIERMRIPLQRIPMVNSLLTAITLIPKAAGFPQIISLTDTFSLFNFLEQLNANANLIVSISSDGRILLGMNFTNFSLLLNPVIAAIFDTDQVLGLALIGQSLITGGSPVYDRMDQLFKVQIEAGSGLSQIQQEIIDTNVFRTLLTDFIVPSNFNMSGTIQPGLVPPVQHSLNVPVRQDLEFNNAASRRLIMFRGNAPIQNVTIEATAIYRDGTRNRIILPPRSVMEIKLAFWRK